jgi:hypothetical protein
MSCGSCIGNTLEVVNGLASVSRQWNGFYKSMNEGQCSGHTVWMWPVNALLSTVTILMAPLVALIEFLAAAIFASFGYSKEAKFLLTCSFYHLTDLPFTSLARIFYPSYSGTGVCTTALARCLDGEPCCLDSTENGSDILGGVIQPLQRHSQIPQDFFIVRRIAKITSLTRNPTEDDKALCKLLNEEIEQELGYVLCYASHLSSCADAPSLMSYETYKTMLAEKEQEFNLITVCTAILYYKNPGVIINALADLIQEWRETADDLGNSRISDASVLQRLPSPSTPADLINLLQGSTDIFPGEHAAFLNVVLEQRQAMYTEDLANTLQRIASQESGQEIADPEDCDMYLSPRGEDRFKTLAAIYINGAF